MFTKVLVFFRESTWNLWQGTCFDEAGGPQLLTELWNNLWMETEAQRPCCWYMDAGRFYSGSNLVNQLVMSTSASSCVLSMNHWLVVSKRPCSCHCMPVLKPEGPPKLLAWHLNSNHYSTHVYRSRVDGAAKATQNAMYRTKRSQNEQVVFDLQVWGKYNDEQVTRTETQSVLIRE